MDNPSLIFYEKPGCITNAKQKKMLRELGVNVESKSILSEPWSVDSLLSFFESLPVDRWFNENAPMIKNGQIDPLSLTESQALEAMLAEPILIKRPLIRAGEQAICGFDIPKICDELSLIVDRYTETKELHECSKRDDSLKEESCP